jgi:hypothetical protein
VCLVCVSLPLIFVRRLMRSPSCLCVCVLLSNFLVFCAVHVVTKESRLLVLPRSSCVCYEITLFLCNPLIFKAYDTALLSVPLSLLGSRSSCVSLHPTFFLSVWSVSYQRKVGDQFFPELHVNFFHLCYLPRLAHCNVAQ